jgi:integrase
VELQTEWIEGCATSTGGREQMFNDGSDHHRISVHDLEQIYTEAKKVSKHNLVCVILITTGMRVGGLAQIKTEHVVIIMSNEVEVKQTGRMIEQGKKWFTVVMNEHVQKLMYEWIVNHRPVDPSPYLFPGQRTSLDHMTATTIHNIFQGWCKPAGLTDKEFHPYALHPSFAHILLGSGNAVDVVSKLLNHSSIKVTEQFYLKEAASDIAERAIIPWLTKTDRKNARSCLRSLFKTHRRHRTKVRRSSRNVGKPWPV